MRILTLKYSFSLIAFIFVVVAMLTIHGWFRPWENPGSIIKDDVQSYYFYLPAAFVHHDLTFDFYNNHPEYCEKVYIPVYKPTGARISKMTLGMSFVYAPFFLVTHYLIAPMLHEPGDVYSMPYRIALVCASLLFMFLGLWHLRKFLLQYFNDGVVGLTLLIVGLGTNLVWYTTYEPGMSHTFNFALVVVLLRLVQRWLRNPGFMNALWPGLVFGLLVLIRPTNILFGVVFLFLPDGNEFQLKERLLFLKKHLFQILFMILAFLFVWAPQLIMWKLASGNLFFYSYDKEGFFFLNPQWWSSWFSWRKGWFLYTPLMFLTLPGLIPLFKQNRSLFLLVVFCLVLLTWVNASWWSWWFGGSHGARPYIDGYGIFAIALAAFLQFLSTSTQRISLKIGGIVIIVLFIMLNLFQTWQYKEGLMHFLWNTKESYSLNFLKTTTQPGYSESLVRPDHSMAKIGKYYPITEITEGERSQLKQSIFDNKEYLIKYYIGIAPELRGKNISADEWASQQFVVLLKKY